MLFPLFVTVEDILPGVGIGDLDGLDLHTELGGVGIDLDDIGVEVDIVLGLDADQHDVPGLLAVAGECGREVIAVAETGPSAKLEDDEVAVFVAMLCHVAVVVDTCYTDDDGVVLDGAPGFVVESLHTVAVGCLPLADVLLHLLQGFTAQGL